MIRKKNAVVTIASNYMPWENAQKCADIIKNVGYNYGENYYAQHHEEHPQWVIYGSETGSIVQSRGIYHFPMKQSVLSDIDEQCSSLGNSTTSWGAKSVESCILSEIEQPYSSGQFVWSDLILSENPLHIIQGILILDRSIPLVFRKILIIYIRQRGRIIAKIRWCTFSRTGILMKVSE